MEGGHHEYKKGLWNSQEDNILMDYVKKHGVGKWNRISKLTGISIHIYIYSYTHTCTYILILIFI